ncbi:hypothetical protein NEIPOLOT_00958 [Neisseria polysaccharea ATCC 43768]|nr:hypothetical protein NEIPOLOT_00958 [Neisseria polysaccharea ATCC 43768]
MEFGKNLHSSGRTGRFRRHSQAKGGAGIRERGAQSGLSIHRVSFSVEPPPFGAVESDFIWEGRNPFQIRTAHRAVL